MGNNNCCTRNKNQEFPELNNNVKLEKLAFDDVLNKLDQFKPKKNILLVAFFHLQKEGCFGLLHSI